MNMANIYILDLKTKKSKFNALGLVYHLDQSWHVAGESRVSISLAHFIA